MLDELASTGRENSDADQASLYDLKEDASYAQDRVFAEYVLRPS